MNNPACIAAFGLHLRKLRETHDLSQQALADKAHIDKTTIQRIENSTLNPTLDTLASIAVGFEISLPELLNFKY